MIPDSIVIDGERNKRRLLVYINNEPIWLPDKDFKYITILAIARRLDINDGWVSDVVFDGSEITYRYMHRLRVAIKKFMPDWEVYENNYKGTYRLVMDNPDNIEIRESVGKFEDSEVFRYYLKINEEGF